MVVCEIRSRKPITRKGLKVGATRFERVAPFRKHYIYRDLLNSPATNNSIFEPIVAIYVAIFVAVLISRSYDLYKTYNNTLFGDNFQCLHQT